MAARLPLKAKLEIKSFQSLSVRSFGLVKLTLWYPRETYQCRGKHYAFATTHSALVVGPPESDFFSALLLSTSITIVISGAVDSDKAEFSCHNLFFSPFHGLKIVAQAEPRLLPARRLEAKAKWRNCKRANGCDEALRRRRKERNFFLLCFSSLNTMTMEANVLPWGGGRSEKIKVQMTKT